MTVVKVIKVIGSSEESWEDAAETAYMNAHETVEDIQGMKVKSWTANVDDNGITEYKATVEISFLVHEG